MTIFRLTLQPTYYEKGFFNVPVDFERFVRRDDGPVILRLGAAGPEIAATVNRRANTNGTPRIMGGVRLREWFRAHFNPTAVVPVDLSRKDVIVLHGPTPAECRTAPDKGQALSHGRAPVPAPRIVDGAEAGGSAVTGLVDSPETGSAIYLVSCVSEKRSEPCAAKDLYVSDWFRKARAYVESRGGGWFILSAKYGLLAPEAIVAPYEQTLNTMDVDARRAWAAKVIEAMERSFPAEARIVVLAGARYREFLLPYLRRKARVVEIPMEGLRIGEQLNWLDSHRTPRE